MDRTHPLRFVRSLALAALVPGCTSVAPTPESQPPLVAAADTGAVTPSDATPAASDASPDQVDAGLPFSSGPIVPPELPEGFA